MVRETTTKFPGAVRAIELWLKADGTEAATEAETQTIIRSEINLDDETIFKVILRPTSAAAKD